VLDVRPFALAPAKSDQVAHRVVGAFPDGQSALILTATRLRHVAGTAWSTKRYLTMQLLKDQHLKEAITA
jgi:hypothetical protein